MFRCCHIRKVKICVKSLPACPLCPSEAFQDPSCIFTRGNLFPQKYRLCQRSSNENVTFSYWFPPKTICKLPPQVCLVSPASSPGKNINSGRGIVHCEEVRTWHDAPRYIMPELASPPWVKRRLWRIVLWMGLSLQHTQSMQGDMQACNTQTHREAVFVVLWTSTRHPELKNTEQGTAVITLLNIYLYIWKKKFHAHRHHSSHSFTHTGWFPTHQIGVTNLCNSSPLKGLWAVQTELNPTKTDFQKVFQIWIHFMTSHMQGESPTPDGDFWRRQI